MLGYDQKKIVQDGDIYMATPVVMVNAIVKTNNRHNHVMIVGHNPGVTELAALLAPGETSYFPPGGLLCLKLFVDSWDQVTADCGIVEFQDFPVSLRNI